MPDENLLYAQRHAPTGKYLGRNADGEILTNDPVLIRLFTYAQRWKIGRKNRVRVRQDCTWEEMPFKAKPKPPKVVYTAARQYDLTPRPVQDNPGKRERQIRWRGKYGWGKSKHAYKRPK